MREAVIEAYLVKEVKRAGGVAEKFSSPSRRFVPDRICSWSRAVSDRCGVMLDYVETKATGEKPNAGQLRDHARRRRRGFKVYVIDSKALVDAYIEDHF